MWRRLVVSFSALVFFSLLVLSILVHGAVMLHLLSQQKTAQLMQTQMLSTGLARQGQVEQERALATFGKQILGRLILVDAAGNVTFDSFLDRNLPSLSRYPEVTQALQGKPAANHYRAKGIWSMQAAVPLWQGRAVSGALVYVQSLDSLATTLRQLDMILFFGGLLVLALTFTFSSLAASRIVRPIRLLDVSVRGLARGEPQPPLLPTGKDELATLTGNFNLMADKLQQLEQQRRQFMADAAHELRTPLASLQALLEPLAEGADQPVAKYHEFLEDGLLEVGRLHHLVEELLQVNRLEGTVHLQKASVDPSQILQAVARLMAGAAEVAQVQLDLHTQSAPIELLADGEKLKQVLVNLLDNAIKHSSPGSTVTIDERLQDGYYLLTVRDQGAGIAAADLPHIFERFFRGDKARRRDTGGSGLGLAIALRIVELHAGSVSVESELGKGSCFTVRLPLI